LKYKNPICDCGSKLYIYREVVYCEEQKIRNDGIPYKSYDSSYLGPYDSMYNVEKLSCKNCDNIYWYEIDDRNRVFRKQLMAG